MLVVTITALCACDLPAGGCQHTEVTTDTGLRYEDLRCGDGDVVEKGDEVTIRYTGGVQGGEPFDSSRPRGNPYSFVVGARHVLAGLDEGVEGMSEGGVRRLVVPAELGYGEQRGPGKIPPHSTLIFRVDLIRVEPR